MTKAIENELLDSFCLQSGVANNGDFFVLQTE